MSQKAIDRNSALLHRVSFADRDAAVVDGVKIEGHTVGRADFVLSAIATTDISGLVVEDIEMPPEILLDCACGLREFL